MSVLLKLSSTVFGAITWLRGWLYDRGILRTYHSSLPVVSIGNITAGGNGKTPLCLYIAEELQKRGRHPVILSRGYGGRTRGPHRVKAEDSPELVGDEPVLMAKRGFPVYVARRRAKGAKLIEREQAGDVIVLDDGLQHRALHRDVDIVSIFAGTERSVVDFLKGELLPLGMFRESRRRALRRASLIVVSQRKVMSLDALPPVDERILRVLPDGSSVFRSFLEPGCVVRMDTQEEISPSRVCAFAAIANPEGFFQSLGELGFSLGGTFPFPDHHSYTENDVIRMMAKHPGILFLCTEKDAVKLTGMRSEIRERIGVVYVSARVVPIDAFIAQILRRIER
jgi:tetraacyldisaccharide 4'-kinase